MRTMHSANMGTSYYEELKLAIRERGPDAREWLQRMGRQLSFEDDSQDVAQWIERIHNQRLRLNLVAELIALDDPGALRGEPVAEPSTQDFALQSGAINSHCGWKRASPFGTNKTVSWGEGTLHGLPPSVGAVSRSLR